MPQNKCLTEKELWSFVESQECGLSQIRQRHFEKCVACQKRLELLKASLSEMHQYLIDDQMEGLQSNSQEGLPSTNITPSQSPREPFPPLVSSHQESEQIQIAIKQLSGRYQVVRRLSGGGQGQIYLAHDTHLRRDVAIKLGNTFISDDSILTEQILNEGERLASVNHPQIATVFDAGIEAGRSFIVMEYVRGETLHQILEKRSLSSSEIRKLTLQIAAGVETLHQQGILHLDLKPENIIITPKGDAKIVDLGASWVVSEQLSNDALGVTVEFAPPEQVLGHWDQIDQRSDIFGIGAILLSMLVRRGSTSSQIHILQQDYSGLWEVCQECMEGSQISPSMRRICLKALASNPLDRFDNVSEMIVEIKRTVHRRQALAVVLAGTVFVLAGLSDVIHLQFNSKVASAPATAPRVFTEEKEQQLEPSSQAVESYKERRLLIRAVNAPEKPLQFCLWSDAKGMFLLPAQLKKTTAGMSTLIPRNSHEGLNVANMTGSFLVLVVAAELSHLNSHNEISLTKHLQDHVRLSWYELMAQLPQQPFLGNSYLPNSILLRRHSPFIYGIQFFENQGLLKTLHCEIDLKESDNEMLRCQINPG